MKKLLFAVCAMFGAVAVNAQDSTSTSAPATQGSTSSQGMAMQEDGRAKIKSQELPEAVKSSLESQEFRGWLVSSAYKMDGVSSSGTASTSSQSGSDTTATSTGMGDESGMTEQSTSSADTTDMGGNAQAGSYAEEVFIVELKNGAQTKTVRFNKDGKKLDDMGEMNSDQK